MKLITKEMSKKDLDIDRQAEMLSNIKMAKHYDDVIEGKAKSNLVKISDIGIYECRLPLPEQKDYLKNYMSSVKTPTGQEWLDITPIDAVKAEADAYKIKHGIDVSVEAFNSYQRVRSNPDLLTFRRLTKEEYRKIFFQ